MHNLYISYLLDLCRMPLSLDCLTSPSELAFVAALAGLQNQIGYSCLPLSVDVPLLCVPTSLPPALQNASQCPRSILKHTVLRLSSHLPDYCGDIETGEVSSDQRHIRVQEPWCTCIQTRSCCI